MADPTIDSLLAEYTSAPAAPEKLDVVDPSGRIGSIPASQYDDAQKLGYRIAQPEEIRRHDLEARYGGVGDTLAAVGTGALGGLTAGLSDVAISELGGREYLQGLEEVHPVARMGGQIVGTGLGLALGGEGAAARAAGEGVGAAALGAGRLLAAPTRAIGALGEAAGGLLGEGLLGTVGRGAVEGAIYGAGDQFAQAAIQDKALTAEALGTSLWHGALLGGGGALAVAAPLKALGYGVEKASNLLTKGGADRVESSAMGLLKNPVAREQAVFGVKELPKVADELVPQVGKVFDAEELVSEAFKRGAKVKQIAAKMPLTDAEAKRLVEGIIDTDGLLDHELATIRKATSIESIESALSRGQQHGTNALSRLDDVVSVAKNSLRAAKGASAAEYYAVLDNTKRELGLALEGMSAERIPRVQDVYLRGKTMYDALRKELEDPRKWGEAGNLQAKMNAAWDRSLQDREVLGYGKNTRGQFGEDKWSLNEDKVRSSVTSGDKNLDSWLERAKGRLQVAKDNLVLDGPAKTKLDAALEVIDGIRDKVKTAQNTLANAELLGGMRTRGTVLRSGLAGGVVVHGLMGTSMFSPAGMAASALVGAVASPGHLVSGLAHAQRAAQKFAQIVNSDVTKAFGKALKVGAGRAAGVVGREYERQRDRVTEWSAQPGVVAREAAQPLHAAGLPDDMVQGAVDVALRAHQVLASIMPKPNDPQGAASWLATAKLMDNPKDLVKKIFAGEVSLAQVKALAQVMPKQVEAIQKRMLSELVDLQAKGKELPYQYKLALSYVGIPADPFAKFTKSLQANYTPTNRPPPPGSKVQRAPDISSLWQTQESRGYRGK